MRVVPRVVKKGNNESDWERQQHHCNVNNNVAPLSENEAPFFRQTHQDSAAFLIGRAAEARLAERRAVAGGEGRRRRRQLLVAGQAVVTGNGVAAASGFRPRPAATAAAAAIDFGLAGVPAIQQPTEGLGDAAQRLVHVSDLRATSKLIGVKLEFVCL